MIQKEIPEHVKQLQKHYDDKLANDKKLHMRAMKAISSTAKALMGTAPKHEINVHAVKVGTGATWRDAFPDLPKDGWGYADDSASPAFTNITVDDINQWQIADCYFLAPLMTIADTNPSYIKTNLLQPEIDTNGNIVVGKYVVFFTQTINNIATWVRVHVNSQIDNIQAHAGPDGDIWVALIEKAFAYFRTGADLFHSLDYGSPYASFQTLGLTATFFSVTQPALNINTTLQALQSGQCLTLCTGEAPVQGMVADHCYGFRSITNQPTNGTVLVRNPWGSSGGTLYNFLSPSDLSSFLYLYGGIFPTNFVPQPAPPLPAPTPPTPPPTPVIGSGNGLAAQYYASMDLSGTPIVELDPTVNFTWNGAPIPNIPATSFSVRWSGQIMPKYTDNYSISTITDDGVRVWINNVLVIDNWTDHASTANTGTVAMVAGTLYPIKIEYYQDTGGAQMQLEWSNTWETMTIIPTTQLYADSSILNPPSSSSSSAVSSSSSSSASSDSSSSQSSMSSSSSSDTPVSSSSSSSSSTNPNGEVRALMLYTLPTTTPFLAVNAIRVGGSYEVCTEGGKNLYWTSTGNCVLFTVRVTANTTANLIIRYYSEKGAKIGMDISGVAQPTVTAAATGAKQSWNDLTVAIPTLQIDPTSGEGIHIFKLYAVAPGMGIESIRFV